MTAPASSPAIISANAGATPVPPAAPAIATLFAVADPLARIDSEPPALSVPPMLVCALSVESSTATEAPTPVTVLRATALAVARSVTVSVDWMVAAAVPVMARLDPAAVLT